MTLAPFIMISPLGPDRAEEYTRAGFLPVPCGPGDLEARLLPPSAPPDPGYAMPVALFIGEGVPHPVAVARAAHRLAPDCPIVFLAQGSAAASLKRELSPVSMIGTYWTLAPEDVSDQVRILERCRDARERKRKLRTTLDKLQGKLTSRREEGETRRHRLLLSEHYLSSILDQARDAILSLDPGLLIVSWNKGAETLFGWRESEILGRSFFDLIEPEGRQRAGDLLKMRTPSSHALEPVEMEFLKRDGAAFPGEFTYGEILDDEGRLIGNSVILRDVAARKRLEAELLQSQKMEAVGKLAGGIAHDFNNLLTAINGYAELVSQELPPEGSLGQMVAEIRKSGERAANLTSQLLLYSRRQIMIPEVLDLNTVVSDMWKLLKRLIGENIRVELALEPELDKVKADRLRMEQILMNLVLNARDAMPEGGRLAVETGNVLLDADHIGTHPNAKAGPHVMLAVIDSGIGMTPEVQKRMFDPFFTTKPVGKGTGLGLSSVYGAVQQFRGSIRIHSEPGRGTAIRVYLPRASPAGSGPSADTASTRPAKPATIRTRPEASILLVEDEEPVRGFARQVLQRAGYTVLDAAEGREALRMLEGRRNEGIDLLITDIVMPGMGGRQLAKEVSRRRPGVKVLYISGYNENAVAQHDILDGGIQLLQKPFSQAHLLEKVESLFAGA